jgi:hypothetical protein
MKPMEIRFLRSMVANPAGDSKLPQRYKTTLRHPLTTTRDSKT